MPVVIKNINIEIKKGEYIAFTGHSGCGKSTLLKLLMTIYELDSGERYLKNNDGSKTVIIVTHRPTVYKICDRVIDCENM